MAYDEELAERIRRLLQGEAGLTEKPMFGGLAFLLDGKLAVSASSRGGLLLRVDPAQTESLVRDSHVRRFEMRGRELDGWLHVNDEALRSDAEFRRWLGYALSYVRSLPTS